jgi:hypothetical protein
MLVDITRVPDAPIKCSELRQHRVVPGLDDPIHRVRLQGNDLTGIDQDHFNVVLGQRKPKPWLH